MKNVRSLVQQLKEEYPEQFQAFSILDDNINELLARVEKLEARNLKYFCRLWHNTSQATVSGANLFLNFNQTIYPELGNMHDNINDPDKVFIRRNGVYHVSACAGFEANSTGDRVIVIDLTRGGVTSSIVAQVFRASAVETTFAACACSFYCYKDDYLRVRVRQNSGGPLNINASSPYLSPMFSVSERQEDLDPSEYGLLNPEENTY